MTKVKKRDKLFPSDKKNARTLPNLEMTPELWEIFKFEMVVDPGQNSINLVCGEVSTCTPQLAVGTIVGQSLRQYFL